MADAGAGVTERTARLQVAAARQEESGQGIARLPRETMAAIGITEGDVIEIEGKRTTAARALLAYPEDEGLDVIRLDGLQRANVEVGSGEHVTIRRADSRPAQRVVFAPAQKDMRLKGTGQALQRNFFQRPLVAGDLPPRFPGRVDISPPVLIHMKVGLVGLFLSSTLCVLFNRSICSLFVPVAVGSS